MQVAFARWGCKPPEINRQQPACIRDGASSLETECLCQLDCCAYLPLTPWGAKDSRRCCAEGKAEAIGRFSVAQEEEHSQGTAKVSIRGGTATVNQSADSSATHQGNAPSAYGLSARRLGETRAITSWAAWKADTHRG